jgi:hypothetical protein
LLEKETIENRVPPCDDVQQDCFQPVLRVLVSASFVSNTSCLLLAKWTSVVVAHDGCVTQAKDHHSALCCWAASSIVQHTTTVTYLSEVAVTISF